MRYIKPALLVVNLRTVHMMAESLVINTNAGGDEEYTITGSEQILTKENNSIWDSEW